NGNKITFTHDTSGRVLTITDSLNRVVTFAYNVIMGGSYGTGDLITFNGSGGTPRYLRVTRTTLSEALRSGFSINYNLFPQYNQSTFNPNPSGVPKTLWLPDDRKYEFRYNDYGEVARIELPTGGASEYDWAAGVINGPASGAIGRWNECGNFVGGYSYEPGIYRRVIERRIYKDLNSSVYESRETISRPESINSALAGKINEGYQNSGAVEVNTYNYSGTMLESVNHTFDATNSPYNSITYSLIFYDAPWQEGKERLTEAFATNGSSRGPLLRSEESTLGNGHIDAIITTLSDSNQVTKKTFVYDTHNNQTDVYEYDYGAGAAPAKSLRRTHTEYLTTNSVNGLTYNTPYPIDPANPIINTRNLPLQRIVYTVNPSNGAETWATQTKYEYDLYDASANHAPLKNRTNISGLDSAYTTSYQTRGNVTKVDRWLNSSGSSLVSSWAQYDIAGNVVTAIDENGNAAIFDFSDRFGSPDDD